ncbi:MAG: hypothetical protein IEMM0008_0042 [bacterium]|nr:MAG: hypothetical protein IEMM0008_0042 [bacterium]
MPKRSSSHLLLFSLMNFFVAGTKVVGSSISSTLFLKQFGVPLLPYIFLLGSILLILLSQWLIHLAKKLPSEKLLQRFSLYISLVIAVFWGWLYFALPFHDTIGIFLLSVTSEMASFLLMSLLWNLTSEYFDLDRGKRKFPIIVAIGTVGGIFGGLVISFLAPQTDIIHLLLFWSAMTLSIAPFLLFLRRAGKPLHDWIPVRGKRGGFRGSLFRKFKLHTQSFLNKPLLFYLVLATILGTLLIYSLDFLSNNLFNERYSSRTDLVRFLGLFNSLGNGLSLGIQFFLFPYLIQRMGVANSITIFPFATVLSSVLLFIFPGLGVAILGQFTRRQFKEIFYQLVNDLVFNALHHQERNRVRTILRGVVKAGGAILASALILLSYKVAGYNGVALLAVGGALTYVFVGIRLKRHYLNSLKVQMVRRSSVLEEARALNPYLSNVPNDEAFVRTVLAEGHDDILALYLKSLDQPLDQTVHPLLRKCYPKRDHEVQLAIIPHLTANEDVKDREFLNERLIKGDDEIRMAILLSLSDIPISIGQGQAGKILDDPDASMTARTKAFQYLFKTASPYARSKLYNQLFIFIRFGTPKDFTIALQTASELKERDLLSEFIPMLHSDSLKRQWAEAVEPLESGDDDSFAKHYHALFCSSKGSLRRKYLRLLGKVPCREFFPLLWEDFSQLTSQEQIILLTIAREQGFLSYEEILEMLKDTKLSSRLFNEVALLWRSRSDSPQSPEGYNEIKTALISTFHSQIKDYHLVHRLEEPTQLLEWVLQENAQSTIKKLIAWELIAFTPSDEFKYLLGGLFAPRKEESDKAMEIIENVTSYSKAQEIRKLLKHLSHTDFWETELYSPVPSEIGINICMELLNNHPILWTQTVCLYTISQMGASKNIDVSDRIKGMSDSTIQDSCFQEACHLFTSTGDSKMLSTFEKIMILRKVPFFSELSSEDLRLISSISDEVAFSAGDILIKSDEMGNELYILEHGRVRVYRGERVIDLEPPSHIGEMAIFTGGRRTATVEALEPINTIAIKSDKFHDLITEFPHIIFPVVRIMLERLLQREES